MPEGFLGFWNVCQKTSLPGPPVEELHLHFITRLQTSVTGPLKEILPLSKGLEIQVKGMTKVNESASHREGW